VSGVHIEQATVATEELKVALERLLPQLSSSWSGFDEGDLENLVADEATCLLVARNDDGTIIGTTSLICAPIPTGIKALIEDVVVDESARGLGAAKALVTAALNHAHALGATSVDLTSRPSREAANALYVALGFTQRETNVYRFSLEG
jgi:ribosomal protein S18 acetylase RimI-like enzyme